MPISKDDIKKTNKSVITKSKKDVDLYENDEYFMEKFGYTNKKKEKLEYDDVYPNYDFNIINNITPVNVNQGLFNNKNLDNVPLILDLIQEWYDDPNKGKEISYYTLGIK